MTEWQPEFEGQRPPFEPGNDAHLVHGARSERRIAPMAARIEREARAGEGWPPYLESPAFGPAVAAWARSEAVVALLWQWLAEQDIDTALADVTTEESTEAHAKGKGIRRSTSRRTVSVLEQLRKAEAAARTHRQSLGLDPVSQARISRDLSASKYMAGLSDHPLTVALDRIEAERRVLEADAGD